MTCFLNNAQEIHANYNPCSQAVDLYLFDLSLGGRAHVQFKAEANGEFERCDPSLSLGTVTAQRLMDQLWNCGYRPTEGSGSAGSLAATQRHLEDMRTIAFSQLKIPNENGPQVSKITR